MHEFDFLHICVTRMRSWSILVSQLGHVPESLLGIMDTGIAEFLGKGKKKDPFGNQTSLRKIHG